MTDDELPDRSGEVIAGRFRLTKRLGAGGMGEVYRATNEVAGREVAIKILKPEYAKSPDVVQRVQREAKAANVVRHANIVDVLDVLDDTTTGAPVIVQELLVGEDLASFLKHRGTALSEAEALDLMTPVADALGCAHAAGIMHRDLKLENVFLDRRTGVAVPKVLDFGLSRYVGEAAVTRLTATGVAMGTPMYMSPEQVQGQRDIDQRTDVWALGIMLYELVASRLPFEGESLGAIFVKVCTVDPPPLRTLAPAVSEAFVGVVARCLQRDRENRFENAGQLATALRAVRGGASNAVSAFGAIDDARAHTLAASASTLGPASNAPSAPVNTTLKPQPPRSNMAVSIGPTVSAVPHAPRSSAKLVGIAAALAFSLVAFGGWLATRGGEATSAAVTPRAAVRPPVVIPAAPVAPIPAGTSQYDHPPGAPTPAGTRAYDAPAAPAMRAVPVQPATTAYDDTNEPVARSGRRGRRRPHGRAPGRPPTTPAQGSAPDHQARPPTANPGTTVYDGTN